MDYEGLAEGIQAEVEREPLTPRTREFYPVSHQKYAGIATDKGYAQKTVTRLVRTHYNHEALIDVLIAEPTITYAEIAERFKRTRYWVSVVVGSDIFQAALAKRRDDVTDPFLVATIEERFKGLAEQSLEIIAEKLEKTRNQDLALKALEISSKAFGFGARPGAQVQNNFVVQLPDKSPDSSEWTMKYAKPA